MPSDRGEVTLFERVEDLAARHVGVNTVFCAGQPSSPVSLVGRRMNDFLPAEVRADIVQKRGRADRNKQSSNSLTLQVPSPKLPEPSRMAQS
ncbi:hypothetical protein IST455A_05840 [Burkholderia multivorans]|nr:hypothetical protein IST419_05852 [Burkholderia multivorans]CAB5318734.1 hypothetical protein IST424_05836 [Burkholderia multivorans]CAB5320277.1 hypothetical protein IST453_05846 [Burkholderia multivorans]CAB5320312.1 hypothetical protein IST455A_05840 [Burkholderia multivorans]CAB5321728.1 hypothetical protein IST455B_05835 [Burkholderia multivorans]